MLCSGGNGGVGGFAVQLARAYGLSPIVASCSAESSSRVLSLGATHTVDYKRGAVVEDVLSICPDGVDFALDCVSSESATSLLRVLAVDGQLATIAGVVTRGGSGDSYIKGWSVHDVALGPAAYWTGKPGTLAALGRQFLDLQLSAGITSMVTNVLSLDAVPAALAATTSTGKTIVKLV